MRWKGVIDAETFHGYCRDGSRLGVHPEASLPGIDAATGSLGQGLSVGCGMAYGLRLRSSAGRVYVLVSDAECNEGQVWEAAMFAAHHGLANLTVVVDLNGLQALGSTKDILDLHPLDDKWRAFGWECHEVDGHDLAALLQVLETPRPSPAIARELCWPIRCSARAFPSWKTASSGTTVPWSDRLYATAIAEMEAAG